MKGYIPIEIPTKKYIKAYLQSQLGQRPQMTTMHPIGTKFYDLLLHKTNDRRTAFANVRYHVKIKVYEAMMYSCTGSLSSRKPIFKISICTGRRLQIQQWK